MTRIEDDRFNFHSEYDHWKKHLTGNLCEGHAQSRTERIRVRTKRMFEVGGAENR